MSKEINILVLDDNLSMLETLKDILGAQGYKVAAADNINSAKAIISRKFYNLILADLRLTEGSGLDLLKYAKQINNDTIFIVFTAYSSIESAITAVNDGAYGYLQKPLNIEELKIRIQKALKSQSLSLENRFLIAKLKKLSLKDTLTGIYNYRYLTERLSQEFKRAKRSILPLSLIMLDIDYFKSINGLYGRGYADNILKEFVASLKNYVRVNDIVARYSGEEFVIVMPDTDKQGAFNFSLRMLNYLKERVFDRKGNRIRLKISVGSASFPEDSIDAPLELIDAAEEALRQAKEQGGNRLQQFYSVSDKQIKKIMEDGCQESVQRLKKNLVNMKNRANRILLESIFAFAKAVEAKDYDLGKHSENMISIATEIGKRLKLSREHLNNLQYAAMLHDLGKIGIPDEILHKKGRLTKSEYEKIKHHPVIGAEIIRDIHFLKDVVPMILHHHERYDGLGYSMGLRAKEIPLGARIISIADVYQALISDRPYRKAYSKKEAIRIIKEGSGVQFDPQIVKVFLEILEEEGK